MLQKLFLSLMLLLLVNVTSAAARHTQDHDWEPAPEVWPECPGSPLYGLDVDGTWTKCVGITTEPSGIQSIGRYTEGKKAFPLTHKRLDQSEVEIKVAREAYQARERFEEEKRLAAEKERSDEEKQTVTERKRAKEIRSQSKNIEQRNDSLRLALDILSYTLTGSKRNREAVYIFDAEKCVFEIISETLSWFQSDGKLYVNNIIPSTVAFDVEFHDVPWVLDNLLPVHFITFSGDNRVCNNSSVGRLAINSRSDLERVRRAWGLLFLQACEGASPSEF